MERRERRTRENNPSEDGKIKTSPREPIPLEDSSVDLSTNFEEEAIGFRGLITDSMGELITARCVEAERTRILNLQDVRMARLPIDLERWLADHDIEFLNISRNRLLDLPPFVVRQTKLKTLIASRNQLRTLPDLACFTNLVQLDLSFNMIGWLPESFYELARLESISIQGNFVVSIDATRISKLGSLRLVDFSSNRLTQIPSAIFSLPQISSLTLDGNSIEKLPDRGFSELGSPLRSLSMIRSRLRTFPEALCNFAQSLQTLDLSSNQLSLIEGDLQRASLTELNISNNRFRAVPTSLCFLTSLTSLNMSKNLVPRISADLARLEASLVRLNLSENKIYSISSVVGALTTLGELDLSGNAIREVPAELSQLRFMSTLKLSSNKITSIHESLFGLEFLERLDLSFNRLDRLALSASSLPKLIYLNVRGNRLEMLPDVWKPHRLVELDLAYNQFSRLRSLAHMTRLQILRLSGNRLESLPSHLGSLPLRQLWAGENELTEINDPLPRSLNTLGISGNHLSHLPANLSELSSLETLLVSRNDLDVLPSVLSTLTSLVLLDLSCNAFEEVGVSFAELARLKELNLQQNRLRKPPADLPARLRVLDCAANEFTDPILLEELERSLPQLLVRGRALSLQESEVQPWMGVAETIGMRSSFEDSHVISVSLLGLELVDLYGVFDGHGGRNVAEHIAQRLPVVLSRRLLPYVANGVLQCDSLGDILREAIAEVDEETTGMLDGATALVFLVVQTHVHVAHLGDSRLVLARRSGGGELVVLTEDHTPQLDREWERVNGLDRGFIVGQRVLGSVAVTRSLGDHRFRPFVSNLPDIMEITLTSDDGYMIAACDGLWDAVSNEAAIRSVAMDLDAGFSPTYAAAHLRDQALEQGSLDNITVMVIRLSRYLPRSSSDCALHGPLFQASMKSRVHRVSTPQARKSRGSMNEPIESVVPMMPPVSYAYTDEELRRLNFSRVVSDAAASYHRSVVMVRPTAPLSQNSQPPPMTTGVSAVNISNIDTSTSAADAWPKPTRDRRLSAHFSSETHRKGVRRRPAAASPEAPKVSPVQRPSEIPPISTSSISPGPSSPHGSIRKPAQQKMHELYALKSYGACFFNPVTASLGRIEVKKVGRINELLYLSDSSADSSQSALTSGASTRFTKGTMPPAVNPLTAQLGSKKNYP